MNQNMGRLIRYILIIQRLSGKQRYVPADELISYLNLQMELRGYEVGLSLRTLQRDIIEIESMFEIEIKNSRGKGYYINERSINPDIRYDELLLNFDLLTAMSKNIDTAALIIPEQHGPKGTVIFLALINSIKNKKAVTFEDLIV